MLDLDFWLGLVLYEVPRPCAACRRPIEAHIMAVANVDEEDLHVHCAGRRGWVPSESEAWTLALFRPTEEVLQ